MIWACQTRAMDMRLMVMTQKRRTSPMLDSLTGRCKTRQSQDMVIDLLLLCSIQRRAFVQIQLDRAEGQDSLPVNKDGQSTGHDSTYELGGLMIWKTGGLWSSHRRIIFHRDLKVCNSTRI